ncbi:hypothetical protein ACTOB_003632 [Actinoplanes oblitus]|uniref:Uncharacterized protein n=1 Tax=Actinoplanes oblitus TaxID=3040509 RepID=A0ABY8WSI5_9ACTN|nr:hypothetical protein [Actinoplanes oblitus]WIM99961.1 hypothetical protein ACTOB_003632 [Actinoplanes oblitus]
MFGVCLLLLLPFTLVSGPIGDNARQGFRDLLGVFHHLLTVVRAWLGGRR